MSRADWAAYVAEIEKNLTSKIADVVISDKKGDQDSQENVHDQFSPTEASRLAKIIRKGLVDKKNNIDVQRKVPNSPLYPVKSFDALKLNPNLLKGVYEMGFNAPSKIQEFALPILLADPPRNLIAQSQSGTGKTAAFVLAMLSRVNPSLKYPQVLCLFPTYELAIQNGQVAAHMAKFCPEIEMKFAVRGEELPRRTKLTEHIIFGTPGKVLDWAVTFRAFDLNKITAFVLDEGDIMIATQGHQDQCMKIHKNLSESCQMMFFSATYDQKVMDFAEHIVKNPITIGLRREEKSLDNITQYYVKCANQQEKYSAFTNIYGTVGVGQAIIFCRTRKTAFSLLERMAKDGYAAAVLSNDLTVEQRINALDRFKNGQEKVLITTIVLPPGIGFKQVTIVVNFDLPIDQNRKADWETYLCRIGQTGTFFGKRGIAINLVDSDKNYDQASEENAPDQFNPAEGSLLAKITRKGLVDNKNNIEVQRKDPNSPLYSVKSFEALKLNPNLLKGVYEMGFNAPSKIQELALPILLADPPENLIAQSQSGTGKTAAFVLAMLSRVNPSLKYPQVLCLFPTYELAIQNGQVAAHMAKFCPEIEMKFAVRGEELPRGTKLTEHIIFGTPGKVLDWAVKFRALDLNKITAFVLDEADVMIATQGHQDQCIKIHKNLSESCQMMFFLATYDQEVMDFAEHVVKNPITIRLKREEESLDNITQYYVKCANQQEKYSAITNIYGTVGVGQAIIFCHTRITASWLSEKMAKDGHAVAVVTSDSTVEQRINVLDRFRQGQEKVLITTNVLSRGIDVEQVTIVVNFDLPIVQNRKADCETYLHRIGRAGRFGKRGIAINLVDSESSMQICRDIERHFNRKIKHLNVDDADEIEKIGN